MARIVRYQRKILQPNKACPVLLRSTAAGVELLSFLHPKAGKQIIKGTIEPGEEATAAALRELGEESGIIDATAVRSLGIWQAGGAAFPLKATPGSAPPPLVRQPALRE